MMDLNRIEKKLNKVLKKCFGRKSGGSNKVCAKIETEEDRIMILNVADTLNLKPHHLTKISPINVEHKEKHNVEYYLILYLDNGVFDISSLYTNTGEIVSVGTFVHLMYLKSALKIKQENG